MHAVIATGGKQYKVTTGQIIRIEKLPHDAGKSFDFDQVLLIADGDKTQVGAPTISGAKVKAKVLTHGRADKVKIIKFKRRKHHMKTQGHRQDYTEVEITDIKA